MTLFILIVIAFFLGSIPTGFILGLLQGIDLRKHGSGNIGATNATRVLGKRAGLLTFAVDVSKGALASSLPFFTYGLFFRDLTFLALCGAASILGHCFSPFLKLKGGKGVATSLGAFMVFATSAILASMCVFTAIYFWKRIVSLASLAAAISLPLFLLLFGYPWSVIVIGTLLSGVVIFRHHENISRLLKGEESSGIGPHKNSPKVP